jgi:hypothetical protein
MKKIITQTSNFVANQLHIIIAIIAFIVICLLTQTAKAQDSTFNDHLAKNNEKINIGGSNQFAIFDQAFYNNQVFFVSESHGYAKPHQLDA